MANHQNLFYLGKSITTTTCWEADKVGVFKREGQINQYYLHTRLLLLVCHFVSLCWVTDWSSHRQFLCIPFLSNTKSRFCNTKKKLHIMIFFGSFSKINLRGKKSPIFWLIFCHHELVVCVKRHKSSILLLSFQLKFGYSEKAKDLKLCFDVFK